MKKKLFAAILAAAMALCLLPQASVAAGESGIQLGTGGLKTNDEVYFGQYTDFDSYNVPWVVLNPNGFLLSKYQLVSVTFRAHDTGYYNGSGLHAYMGRLYYDMFRTLPEQAAIKDTELTGDSMFAGESNLPGQKLFPLSYDEADALGWGSNVLIAATIAQPNGRGQPWWLRSSDSDTSARYVQSDGTAASSGLRFLYGIRPALNLDLDAVLFTSAAVGGKASGPVGPGALNANLSPSGKTIWKLTLLDTAPGSDRENFAVSTRSVSVSRAGGNVSVTYAYAKTGTNEYLSALLTDSANHVLYYGRLKSLPAFQDAGTQSITIPALPAGNYTLKIFNEQYNGDYKTDYASAFQDVALTVSGPTPVPTLSPNIPQTGDKAQPGLWIGLVCLAGAGLAASLMLGRRKRG